MDNGIDLVDRIYEAAFVPDLWPDVLDGLKAATGSAAGVLMLYEETRPIGFKGVGPTKDVAQAFIASGAWKENRRTDYFRENPFTGFVIAKDYFSKEFLEREVGLEGRREAGLDEQIGAMIPMPSGELAVFAFDRWATDGRYRSGHARMLNDIHPHLARAALLTARLRLEQAHATASALQAIGLPAAVLSGQGRVRASNALFDDMTSLFLPTAFGGMAIANRAANDLFRQAVETADEPAVRSIPIKGAGNRAPLVIHVLPLRRSAHDIFSGADLLVAAMALNASSYVPSPSVLTGLFDLSPAEARLAMALSRGQSLKDFATEAGITFGTVRKYLDRIYLKTGTHRQNELVALLKGAQPLDTPDEG